jgi:hypothetical protein
VTPRSHGSKARSTAAAVRAVSFMPGATTLCSAADDGSVSLWDVATGDRVARVAAGHSDYIRALSRTRRMMMTMMLMMMMITMMMMTMMMMMMTMMTGEHEWCCCPSSIGDDPRGENYVVWMFHLCSGCDSRTCFFLPSISRFIFSMLYCSPGPRCCGDGRLRRLRAAVGLARRRRRR